jgi:hypothetical protein
MAKRDTAVLLEVPAWAGIAGMLRSGMSWAAIQAVTGSSRATVAKSGA